MTPVLAQWVYSSYILCFCCPILHTGRVCHQLLLIYVLSLSARSSFSRQVITSVAFSAFLLRNRCVLVPSHLDTMHVICHFLKGGKVIWMKQEAPVELNTYEQLVC